MALANTSSSFGSGARVFHWLTAFLIITAIPLGLIANGLPYDTGEELARKALLFSMHKTVGIAAFFIGLARILWALFQTHPAPLHPDHKAETFAAGLVHWLLYVSLVLVPLSGWLHHAATSGFAPIWWPFGQTLPFVPVNDTLAHFFASWHFVFTKVLGVALLLHIAGALKHHFVDRDDTLNRMLGRAEAGAENANHGGRGPFVAAAIIWGAALAGGTALGLGSDKAALPGAELAQVQSDWQVQDGTISISVLQLGSAVEGTFADWTAIIAYDETVTDGAAGSVDVTISVPSLTIGSVTSDAMKPDFFNATEFPTATYSGTILTEGGAHRAEGTLTLKGADVPVNFPFTLEITDGLATMAAEMTLQRLDFAIGESYPDESSLGFPVTVAINLTAQLSE
ncbi:MAG: cytochrome b/b6 domain-containing protein [Pseudomonadota bacterium]